MMFAWWSTKKKTRPLRPKSCGNRIRPFLEGLEARDCPSAPPITAFDTAGMGPFTVQATISAPAAPTITNLTVTTAGPSRAVAVTGQVSSGAGLTVTLAGVVTGTATTGTNGMFTFSGTASGLGQVYASVTDSWGQTGTAAALLTNAAPTITDLAAENTGVQNIWNIEGRVTDEWAPGLTVTFAGVPTLQNVQVTVGNDGWFHIQVQLGPTDLGLLVATVTDWWGATGQAQCFI